MQKYNKNQEKNIKNKTNGRSNSRFRHDKSEKLKKKNNTPKKIEKHKPEDKEERKKD